MQQREVLTYTAKLEASEHGPVIRVVLNGVRLLEIYENPTALVLWDTLKDQIRRRGDRLIWMDDKTNSWMIGGPDGSNANLPAVGKKANAQSRCDAGPDRPVQRRNGCERSIPQPVAG